jgi:hypothetical protein
MMKEQIPWIGVRGFNLTTPDWRDPHGGSNPDLSDSVPLAESNPCGECAALDGTDPRSVALWRDLEITPKGLCRPFSKPVTFVQIFF